MTEGQKRKTGLLLALTAILLSAGIWIKISHNLPGQIAVPDPALEYDESIRRIEALKHAEPEGMNPLCRLQFMSHGGKSSQAVVLVHGYTNCPQQFKALGERLFASGNNVLIAPLPHHGFLDRMTEDHARLQAEELVGYADMVVDIAGGLGERIVMMGISAGGVITAWAAQHREEIDRAIIISPAFGFRAIPSFLTPAVMNIVSFLPDRFSWWNPELQTDTPETYTYPQYSRRALGQILRLGFAVRRDARQLAPHAKSIIMVLNPVDDQIDNDVTRELVKRWQSKGGNVTTFEFGPSLELGHDLIDTNLPHRSIEAVYSKLVELVND